MVRKIQREVGEVLLHQRAVVGVPIIVRAGIEDATSVVPGTPILGSYRSMDSMEPHVQEAAYTKEAIIVETKRSS